MKLINGLLGLVYIAVCSLNFRPSPMKYTLATP